MKRAIKWILSVFLILAVLLGTAWFFLLYRPEWTAGMLSSWGSRAMEAGRYSSAIRYYRWAYHLSEQDPELAIALAEAYEQSGNYTKAEYTLANAIAAGAGIPVYEALCQTYVEQDKLLDAVTMLDQVANPAIKAELDAQRPAAPTASVEPGFYSHYMDVEISGTGTLYISTGAEYPSVTAPYAGPVSLDLGETSIRAVAVGDNGLVSPLSIFGYTIAGVVEPVELSDPALDAYVRQLLGYGADAPLTTADLWGITELSVPAEATNLEDLQLFTGLTSLVIQNQPTLELSFLANMPELTALNLAGSAVSAQDLPLIGNLGKLTSLNLSNCSLSTLSGLENLTTLTSLDLSGNSISDLSPLAGCQGLTSLNLQRNAVSSFSPLAGLSGLTWLNLSYNSLADFSPVSTCAALQYLDVSNNALPSLSGIGSLTALTELNASYNQLADASGIGSCTALVSLNLSNNVLTSMDEMAALVYMTDLDVSYNDILTIPDFPDAAALVTFNGCHNFFEDVSGLAGLSSLNYVYLDYNNITDINVLSSCINLIQVGVFQTNVSDISALLDMDVIVSYNPT